MASNGFKIVILNLGCNLPSLIIKEKNFCNTDYFGLEPLMSFFLNTHILIIPSKENSARVPVFGKTARQLFLCLVPLTAVQGTIPHW